MIRRCAIAWLAALLALSGCEERPIGTEAGAPALWQVAGPGGSTEGWLFGTVHALPDGVEWMTPALGNALERADILLLEIAEPGRGGDVFARLSRTPGQPSLTERVAPSLRDELAILLDEASLTEQDFADVESWAAAILIANAATQAEGANGVDRALTRAFDGRPVRELEGVERQLALFDTLPPSAQRAMLEGVVRQASDPARDPDEARKAWLAADLDVLEQELDTSFLADPVLRERLLDGRNRDWAARADTMMQAEGPILMAVGAGHLVGARGLPALLAQRGYTVRRIQ